MFTRIAVIASIFTLCLVPTTLAEGNNFSTITLHTLAPCQGYNSLEQFASVSPVLPLRLEVNSLASGLKNAPIYFNLQNSSLGTLSAHQGGILEISYKKSGSTTLIGQALQNGHFVNVVELPMEFIAKKEININLFHVYDAEGHMAWKLKQSEMLATLQGAEAILNQAGMSIQIQSQQDLYVPIALGDTINASAQGMSAEESIITEQVDSNNQAVSVFVVWDYQIDNESKVGMNYFVPDVGQVVFITEKTNKPAETLAHELMHSLGLEHTTLGEDYLMSPEENSLLNQCLFSRAEVQQLAQAR